MEYHFDILELKYAKRRGWVKVFVCKDLGGACNWKGRAETVDQLLKKVAKHGATKHNMKGMSDAMKEKIINTIREN